MIGIGLFTATVLVALGIAIGMYISSQIENHIDKRIKKWVEHLYLLLFW